MMFINQHRGFHGTVATPAKMCRHGSFIEELNTHEQLSMLVMSCPSIVQLLSTSFKILTFSDNPNCFTYSNAYGVSNSVYFPRVDVGSMPVTRHLVTTSKAVILLDDKHCIKSLKSSSFQNTS